MAKLIKTKWKLNILDIIIIIVALGALLFVFMLLNADKGGVTLAKGKAVMITYTLQLSDVRQETIDRINEGDIVLERVEKHQIGTVKEISISPYMPTTNDYYNGGKVLSVVPDRYFVDLVIEVTVRDNGKELAVDGFPLRAGSSISASGAQWAGQGLITEIER